MLLCILQYLGLEVVTTVNIMLAFKPLKIFFFFLGGGVKSFICLKPLKINVTSTANIIWMS